MPADPLFTLDPRLAGDTVPVGGLDLCQILLMNEATYPWAILVPQRPALRELTDLARPERHLLMDEIAAVSEAMAAIFKPDKLNVAALGNIVGQLHIHIVARFAGDAAWPGPVWGKAAPLPYAPGAAQGRRDQLRAWLGLDA